MLRTFAKVFGAAFLAIGVFGFIPPLTPDGYLLGLFEVNAVHNVIHLASGAVALAAGFSSERASRTYFQVFGIVYALVTVLGLVYGEEELLGLVAHNPTDVALHFVISATSLFLGFGYKGTEGREKTV
jgi:hypothetical protein